MFLYDKIFLIFFHTNWHTNKFGWFYGFECGAVTLNVPLILGIPQMYMHNWMKSGVLLEYVQHRSKTATDGCPVFWRHCFCYAAAMPIHLLLAGKRLSKTRKATTLHCIRRREHCGLNLRTGSLGGSFSSVPCTNKYNVSKRKLNAKGYFWRLCQNWPYR